MAHLDHHDPGQKATEEVVKAALTPKDKRNSHQLLKLSTWITSHTKLEKAGPSAIQVLLHHANGVELHHGNSIYRAGDTADWFYVLMDGHVHLTDSRDADEGPGHDHAIVCSLGPGSCWGEEEILSNSRRAFTATVHSSMALLLKLPAAEYREALGHVHTRAFEAKVNFLGSLSPLKPLKELVSKLAPIFQEVCFHKGDVIVRQGEAADAMYAIRAGVCTVHVDPHHKEDTEGLGEIDPRRTMQVVTLDAGAIIGDVLVLAKKRRTATVIAQGEVVCLKTRRSAFMKRLPPGQLDVLRQLAKEKLKLMETKVASQASNKSLQDEILHGHNLRLLQQQARPTISFEDQPMEYQQLIHVLRRYKRSAAPKTPAPKGVPTTLVSQRSLLPQGSPAADRSPSRPATSHRLAEPLGGTCLGGALQVNLDTVVGAGAGGSIYPHMRQQQPTLPPAVASHAHWSGMTRDTGLHDGSAAVQGALIRLMPDVPLASYPTQSGQGWDGPGQDSVSGSVWRPVSYRRQTSGAAFATPAACNQPDTAQPPFDYHSRPFVSSTALRSVTSQFGSPRHVRTSQDHSRPAIPPLGLPMDGSSAQQGHCAGGWSSSVLWQHSARVPRSQSVQSPAAVMPALQPGQGGALCLRDSMHTYSSFGGPAQEPSELEAALESLARPLLQARPAAIKKGAAHFKPSIPRAIL